MRTSSNSTSNRKRTFSFPKPPLAKPSEYLNTDAVIAISERKHCGSLILLKSSGKKPYFCILGADHLFYFASDGDQTAKGSISLKEFSSVMVVAKEPKPIFEFSSGEKSIQFRAETVNIMNEWVAQIKETLKDMEYSDAYNGNARVEFKLTVRVWDGKIVSSSDPYSNVDFSTSSFFCVIVSNGREIGRIKAATLEEHSSEILTISKSQSSLYSGRKENYHTLLFYGNQCEIALLSPVKSLRLFLYLVVKKRTSIFGIMNVPLTLSSNLKSSDGGGKGIWGKLYNQIEKEPVPSRTSSDPSLSGGSTADVVRFSTSVNTEKRLKISRGEHKGERDLGFLLVNVKKSDTHDGEIKITVEEIKGNIVRNEISSFYVVGVVKADDSPLLDKSATDSNSSSREFLNRDNSDSLIQQDIVHSKSGEIESISGFQTPLSQNCKWKTDNNWRLNSVWTNPSFDSITNYPTGSIKLTVKVSNLDRIVGEMYISCKKLLEEQSGGATQRWAIQSPRKIEKYSILSDDHYSNLFGLFTEDHMRMIRVISRLSDINPALIAKSFLVVFEHKKMTEQFLLTALYEDIRSTVELNILFRGRSLGTKAFEKYISLMLDDSVERAIHPILLEMSKSKKSVVIDPSKVEDPKQLKKNRSNLINASIQLFDASVQLARMLPNSVRYIFSEVRKCIEHHFSRNFDSQNVVRIGLLGVSSLFFLRYICPSIVNTPLTADLVGSNSANLKHEFSLVAKVLQTLANLRTFNLRSDRHMEAINTTFMEKYLSNMTNLLQDISTPDTLHVEFDERVGGFSITSYGHEMSALTVNLSTMFSKMKAENPNDEMLDRLGVEVSHLCQEQVARMYRGDDQTLSPINSPSHTSQSPPVSTPPFFSGDSPLSSNKPISRNTSISPLEKSVGPLNNLKSYRPTTRSESPARSRSDDRGYSLRRSLSMTNTDMTHSDIDDSKKMQHQAMMLEEELHSGHRKSLNKRENSDEILFKNSDFRRVYRVPGESQPEIKFGTTPKLPSRRSHKKKLSKSPISEGGTSTSDRGRGGEDAFDTVYHVNNAESNFKKNDTRSQPSSPSTEIGGQVGSNIRYSSPTTRPRHRSRSSSSYHRAKIHKWSPKSNFNTLPHPELNVVLTPSPQAEAPIMDNRSTVASNNNLVPDVELNGKVGASPSNYLIMRSSEGRNRKSKGSSSKKIFTAQSTSTPSSPVHYAAILQSRSVSPPSYDDINPSRIRSSSNEQKRNLVAESNVPLAHSAPSSPQRNRELTIDLKNVDSLVNGIRKLQNDLSMLTRRHQKLQHRYHQLLSENRDMSSHITLLTEQTEVLWTALDQYLGGGLSSGSAILGRSGSESFGTESQHVGEATALNGQHQLSPGKSDRDSFASPSEEEVLSPREGGAENVRNSSSIRSSSKRRRRKKSDGSGAKKKKFSGNWAEYVRRMKNKGSKIPSPKDDGKERPWKPGSDQNTAILSDEESGDYYNF